MSRNIYNDNIYDVNKVEDLKETSVINLLSKSEEIIQFELNNDFFKYDGTQLIQYPDFISLKENNLSKSNLLYDSNLEIAEDIGVVIINGLNQESIQQMPNFSLQERDEYIVGSVTKAMQIKEGFDFKKGLEAKMKVDQSSNKLLQETLKGQELESIKATISTTLTMLSMFLIFSKRTNIAKEKEELIQNILNQLNNNTVSYKELLSNNKLREQLPEIELIVNKHREHLAHLPLDKRIIHLLEDEEFVNLAEKMSTSDIQSELSTKMYNLVKSKIENDSNVTDIQKFIEDLYESSGSPSHEEFLKEIFVENIEHFDKNIQSSDVNLSMAFVACTLDKDRFSEFSSQIEYNELSDKKMDNIVSIFNSIESIQKQEKTFNQTV